MYVNQNCYCGGLLSDSPFATKGVYCCVTVRIRNIKPQSDDAGVGRGPYYH